jgi:hypothetical protein
MVGYRAAFTYELSLRYTFTQFGGCSIGFCRSANVINSDNCNWLSILIDATTIKSVETERAKIAKAVFVLAYTLWRNKFTHPYSTDFGRSKPHS